MYCGELCIARNMQRTEAITHTVRLSRLCFIVNISNDNFVESNGEISCSTEFEYYRIYYDIKMNDINDII